MVCQKFRSKLSRSNKFEKVCHIFTSVLIYNLGIIQPLSGILRFDMWSSRAEDIVQIYLILLDKNLKHTNKTQYSRNRIKVIFMYNSKRLRPRKGFGVNGRQEEEEGGQELLNSVNCSKHECELQNCARVFLIFLIAKQR